MPGHVTFGRGRGRNRRAGKPQQLCSRSRMGAAPCPAYLQVRTHGRIRGGNKMRKILEWGGIAAGIVLIAFGIAAIVLGVNGRSTVHSSLKQEQIVGTPDMTPAAIKAEAKDAGIPASIKLPTESVAGKTVDTGARARAFAKYMRIHTLEA